MEKQALKRIQVDSSMIKSVGHSFPRRMLEIEFKDGSVYRYKGVKKQIFKDMLHADSKGKYFHSMIKKNYPYKKYQAQDGEQVKEKYHMIKQSRIMDFDEFVKVAGESGNKKWQPDAPKIIIPLNSQDNRDKRMHVNHHFHFHNSHYEPKSLTKTQKKALAGIAAASIGTAAVAKGYKAIKNIKESKALKEKERIIAEMQAKRDERHEK